MTAPKTNFLNSPLRSQDATARHLLAAIALRIRQSLNLEEILSTTVAEVRQLLQTDRVIIYRFEEDWSGRVIVESVRQEQWSILNRVVSDRCFEQAWLFPYQDRSSRTIDDVNTSGLNPCYLEFLAKFQVRANLVVPIMVRQKEREQSPPAEEVTSTSNSQLWGLLVAHECNQPRQWQEEETTLVEQLSIQVAIAIYQATLIEQLQAELAQRQQAEEYLHRQARIFNSINDGVILTDLDGRIIDWNPAAEVIFGYTKAEVLGKAPGILHLPQDAATLTAEIIQGMEREGRWSGEITFLRKDGREGICETVVVPLRDRHRRIIATIGVNRDITARKQTQAALQETQERLTLAVRGSREGLWDWNIQTNEVFYAPRFKEILGYSEAEMGNDFQAFASRLHLDDRDRVLEAVRKHIEEHLPYEIEYRLRGKTGDYHWILARGQALRDKTGKATRMCGSISNITARKQAEEALRESEARYSSLANDVLDKSAVGIFILNAQFQVVWINQALEQFFALRREEIIGRDQRQLIRDRIGSIFADADEFANRVLATYDNNTYTEHFECHVLPSETRAERWLEHLSQPICVGLYAGGRIEHYTDITERKQAEAELQRAKADLEQRVVQRTAALTEANQRLQWELEERRQVQEQLHFQAQLLDNVRESAIATDLEGRITYWGQGARSLYGYTAEEVMGEQLPLTPNSSAMMAARLLQTIEQGYWSGQYQQHRQDGSSFWVDASIALVRDDRGRPTGLISIERDITERKQAEAALREMEERFRVTANTIPIMIWVAGTDAQSTFFNRAWLEFTGQTLAQAIGKGWVKNVHPDDLGRYVATYRSAFETRQSFQIEYRLRSANGRYRWIFDCGVPRLDASGDFAGYIGSCLDMSDRKQAEATFRESERRWRSLLDNVRLLVVGLNCEGRVEYVNPFFLELTGYSEAEVLGKNWFETFLLPAERSQAIQSFQELLNHNRHPYHQHSITTKMGEEKIVVWNNTRLQNLQKKPIGTMSIGEDVTERYAIERMKDEFVSVVSHELRTPLTSIHGALNLLSTGLVVAHSERGEHVIKIAAESAERLVRLVNDILELERLESGKINLSQQPVSAATLLLQATEQMQVVANRAGIHLHPYPQALECYADRDRAIQVLTNLLSNAIKFSEPGATVWLSIEPQDDESAVLFKVQDQGRGIPPEKLESIFERFHQVDASDSRKKGGTGLGLAICRSIVEQHGGKIWAKSSLQTGSCFYFTLPMPGSQP